ncbi:murein hydrolase activator EnvC family protein [Curtobacterium herbarum]|uniref:murein hydrolase activator EnvC family protein n=1 Tax=Curtobacterium herbarum TaxID=150122 RepID=UPI00195ECB69|nr:M23 family metallopeptidase [Curtobacterium herbarum]MBM7475121.1 murein DD-endopeptidase MepM/ murein hydrolase activator NlpD [Curtobacterium herbarum]MCS6543039.1 M23 family metallopeptidase [Curtobacterium herbarum]
MTAAPVALLVRIRPGARVALPAIVALTVLVTLTVLATVPLLASVAGAASSPPPQTAAQSAARSAARWSWPTATRVVVRPWEAPATDYGPGHRGLDVPAPPGTPVTAPADGTVAFAGQVGGRPVVTIDHGGGLVSTLDPVVPSVSAGAVVRRGQGVGTVGNGHCPATAPCLHLGARVDDRYVDPLPLLPRPAWPVLLPDGQARG